jgi:uncharacterized membrane protein
MLTSWLHLLGLTVYLGALIGLRFVLFPVLSGVQDHETRVALLSRTLKLYNPVQIGALGILVLTGAFQLTELKAVYRDLFLQQIGWSLAVKLGLSFFLIMISTYQAMGVGHRFVKRCELGDPVSPDDLQSVIRRLKGPVSPLLILAGLTAFLGLGMRG